MKDDLGNEIEQREYNQIDMDRILVLNQRTKLVAERVMKLLNATDPFQKTIIFCEDIDHAERMRKAIVNAAGQLAKDNSKYVMRITGDSVEGKAELDNFIDPESRYPVIATTSELLTTGVDAKTCKLIVLDKTINSMTTFKQIVGRGTRIEESQNKYFFTIMDFKKATELFKDPDFDGEPVVIYEPEPDDDPVPPDPEGEGNEGEEGGEEGDCIKKYHVGGVTVYIVSERVEFLGEDGQMVTESYRDYTRYEHFADFNEWLDSEEGQAARIDYGVDALPQPSKALFSGDRNGYDEAFQAFRKACRHEALGESWFQEQLGDDHWFQRNVDHFIQLVDLMAVGAVVPFVGAGISVSAGFSSWKDHLRHQGKTAHIAAERIEALLATGAYETVLEEIEAVRGREVFINEIRDEFSRNPTIPDVVWRISELFTDTVITTNYDRLLEQSFETGEASRVQVINGLNALERPDPKKITVIKLHGDNLLRALSSSPEFDGYAHGKLSVAFRCLQQYLKSIGEQNHLNDDFEWNIHEMLTIPVLQLEPLLAHKAYGSFDYHAIRLISALLQHGKRQHGSKALFCELPGAVNHEFGDYIALSLAANLGLTVPDRLDQIYTGDIQSLCEDAWDNLDKPIDLGFVERVKLTFASIFK